MRRYSRLDRLCIEANHLVQTLLTPASSETHSPAKDIPECEFSEQERRHVAGLMRVDHVGEICAQALYRGQALVAKTEATREHLLRSALEEEAHLAWCEERLRELNSRRSVLNLFWYLASFSLGVVAGSAGDRWSLGFVVETEKQVESHLSDHLEDLPLQDQKSRAILKQMQSDEIHHAHQATALGGALLPAWIRIGMMLQSKVMTHTAYWI